MQGWKKEFAFYWVMGSWVNKLSDLSILKDDSAVVERGLWRAGMDARRLVRGLVNESHL